MEKREQVEGCKFGCDPKDEANLCDECRARREKGELPVVMEKMRVVDLPVSATEDRVVGTLDIEKAIKKGEKQFEPGILAQANRNILYVDEVNLLDDHVVDVLLDSAAMGVNTVEREGVSYSHPAQFVLVGTMNPEEGDLRPQLLDRFGMVADVIGERDVERRMEVVRRRLAFESDECGFIDEYAPKQAELRERIARAKTLLPRISLSEEVLRGAARVSIALEVDGHRADITLVKVAMTLAAFHGRMEINDADMMTAAKLVLPHRMRRRPFEDGYLDFSRVEEILKETM